MIRVTVLGSGTNVHPTRAAAGYLVQTDQTFLLDFGPRTLSNLITSGVDRHRITHILFSHFHADHFRGLHSLLLRCRHLSASTKVRHQTAADADRSPGHRPR
jgi:ribonuclease BN (tRNA processing enzyme)